MGTSASLDDHNSPRNLLFENNTVEYFNAFTGITPGLQATIRNNLFHHQGPPVDGACVHAHIKSQNGILIEGNWAHDTSIKAFRFDRVNSLTATWGVNGTLRSNVWWRTGSGAVKGNKHTVEKNTAFHSLDDATGALFPMQYDPSKSWSIKGGKR